MREESQPQRGEVGLAGVSGLLLRLSDPSCPLLFTQPHARFQPLQKGPCWLPHQLSLFISCSGSALKSSLPGPSLARSLGLAPSGSAPFMPFSGGWCGSHAHQLPGTAEGSVVCSHTSRPLGSGDSVGSLSRALNWRVSSAFHPPQGIRRRSAWKGLALDLVSEEPHHCGKTEGPWTLHTF